MPLVIGLEIAKENSKIAVRSLFFCTSNEMNYLYLNTEKLKRHIKILQTVLLLSVPFYSPLTPITSSKFNDFKPFMLAVAYGAAFFFAMIAIFSLKTQKLIGPQIKEIIIRNEKRILSEELNSERLIRENKLLKNILQ